MERMFGVNCGNLGVAKEALCAWWNIISILQLEPNLILFLQKSVEICARFSTNKYENEDTSRFVLSRLHHGAA